MFFHCWLSLFFTLWAWGVVGAFRLQSPLPSSTTRLSVTTTATSFVNVEENAPRDIQTMDAWCSAFGVQKFDGFQLTTTISDDYYDDVSVMTTNDIPANTPILCVPNGMILSSHKIMQEEIGPIDAVEKLKGSSYVSEQIRHVYLIVKILLEYEKGDQSAWFPWLNAMPRYYTNGASMTPFCYQCLPPLVGELAKNERAKLSTVRAILKKIPFLSEPIRTDREITKWAFQIAYTRSFEDPTTGDLRIVPLVDMFNHGGPGPGGDDYDETGTEITISYDSEGNCYAQTIRDVPAGSPLRMCYPTPTGTQTTTNPSFLFARYGFLDESSRTTFCKLMIPFKKEENRPLLDIIGGGEPMNKMLFYTQTGDVSEEVFDVLLYQILRDNYPGTGLEQQFYQAHMNGDVSTKQAFHQQYWLETSSKLQNHIDTFLYELDQLSAKTHGKDLQEHPRLPIILKHNEFVKRTFLAVRHRYFGS